MAHARGDCRRDCAHRVAYAAVRGGSASAAHKAGFSACLVTDIGGLNDKSFNHLAYVGLQHAQRAGIKGRVIQSKSGSDYIPNLKACVQSGAGITIGVGFLMTARWTRSPRRSRTTSSPSSTTTLPVMKHKPKNVEGLLFSEQQAGYLVGYAAGMWAKSHNGKAVGSVGGFKIPPVDRYIAGFQYGAKKADPGIKTLNGYSNDFVKQAKCKETALNQIAQGSVVEFQVAGQCGLGVLDASHEKGIFGIGVDADQGYLGSWVMTSALKRVDVSVYNAIQSANHGKLKGGGNKQFTASIGGVGYGKWSSKVPASIKNAVAAQFSAAQGRQDQGYSDVRQVDASGLELVTEGRAERPAPRVQPLGFSAMRQGAMRSAPCSPACSLRVGAAAASTPRPRPPGPLRRRAGFASAWSGRCASTCRGSCRDKSGCRGSPTTRSSWSTRGTRVRRSSQQRHARIPRFTSRSSEQA